MGTEVLQTGRGPYERSPGRDRGRAVGAWRRLLRKSGKTGFAGRGGISDAQPEAVSLRQPVAGVQKPTEPPNPLIIPIWNPLQHPPMITTPSIETTPLR